MRSEYGTPAEIEATANLPESTALRVAQFLTSSNVDAGRTVEAVVYVVCFAGTPIQHARHLVGWTSTGLDTHLARLGATISPGEGLPPVRPPSWLQHALERGLAWVLADTWACASPEEASALASSLQRQGGGSRCCSICRPGNGRGGGRGRNRNKVRAARVAQAGEQYQP